MKLPTLRAILFPEKPIFRWPLRRPVVLLIDDAEYEALKPPEFEFGRKVRKSQTPHVHNAIKRFCGTHTYNALCFAIKTGALPNTQAQYLIFGSINKTAFRKFRAEIDA